MATINKITKDNYTPSTKGETPFPVYSIEYNKAVDQINAASLGKLTTPVANTTAGSSATINAPSGKLLIAHGGTAGLATLTVTITNNLATADSIVMASISDYGGNGKPLVGDVSPAAGSIVVEIYNAHATEALSANFGLSFVILG